MTNSLHNKKELVDLRKGELAYVNDQVFPDKRFNIFSIKSFISYGIIEINKNICVHIIYIEREMFENHGTYQMLISKYTW